MTLWVPPCGVTELGQFDREYAGRLPAPPVIRADWIDHLTGTYKRLNKDMDPIDAQVIEALWRVRASGAAVMHTGARFLDIAKLGDDAPRQLENEARLALQDLVRRGDIQITGIGIEVGSDWAELTVDYLNLRAAARTARDRERRQRVRIPEAIAA